jgi:catechol 2,3-dioxygenase-like lactoylglutathione lyase family enzyme
MHADARAGENMNHFCVAVDETFDDLEAALTQARIPIETRMDNNFGARGYARSAYVRDPDGNVLELRTYR